MPEEAPTSTEKADGNTFTQEQLNDLLAKQKGEIQRRYADYDDLKSQVAVLVAEKKKLEEEGKSDSEKVSEQLTALQKQLDEEKEARQKSDAEALRLRVAQAKGLTEAQAKRLQGSTQEELEADADDLLETFGGSKDDPPKPGVGRPKEKLQSGASNEDDEPEITPEKGEEIAESIRKSEQF